MTNIHVSVELYVWDYGGDNPLMPVGDLEVEENMFGQILYHFTIGGEMVNPAITFVGTSRESIASFLEELAGDVRQRDIVNE